MIMRYTSRVVGPQYTKNTVGPALPMRQFNFNFINVLHYCLRRLPKNPVKRAKKNFKKCQKQSSKAKNPFTQPILDTTSVQFSTRVNLKFRTRCGVHPNHRIKLFDLKKKTHHVVQINGYYPFCPLELGPTIWCRCRATPSTFVIFEYVEASREYALSLFIPLHFKIYLTVIFVNYIHNFVMK